MNPSEASLEELAAVEVGGPIAMLNLLSYDGEDGRAAYGRYAGVAVSTIAAVGGSLMYLGQAVDSSEWDTVALVYYPSACAFLDMQKDYAYIAAIPNRTAGLKARLLCPFGLPEVDGAEAVGLASFGSGTVRTALLEWNSPDRPLANDEELCLPSVGSGLVSNGCWNELRLSRRLTAEVGGGTPGLARIATVLSTPQEKP